MQSRRTNKPSNNPTTRKCRARVNEADDDQNTKAPKYFLALSCLQRKALLVFSFCVWGSGGNAGGKRW